MLNAPAPRLQTKNKLKNFLKKETRVKKKIYRTCECDHRSQIQNENEKTNDIFSSVTIGPTNKIFGTYTARNTNVIHAQIYF